MPEVFLNRPSAILYGHAPGPDNAPAGHRPTLTISSAQGLSDLGDKFDQILVGGLANSIVSHLTKASS